jgi:hypothetical protein
MGHIQKHLDEASTVASLTYRAMYNSTATSELSFVHNNAISIIDKITSFTMTLADTSSSVVDILGLLVEARCCRAFLENPLLKLCKLWTEPDSLDQQKVLPIVQHRGYVWVSGHHRMSHQNDPVHSIWCKVISVFSSMIRSARLQSVVYANVDHSIHQQLPMIAEAVLDFVSSFENTLFSCFTTISEKPKERELAEKKGFKGNHPASTISSSSFSFTTNLLSEVSCVTQLFEQMCVGETKNKFARACSRTYNAMNRAMVDMVRVLCTFLGSIGNARELFIALASASKLSYDQHASMFDAHPLLADGK